jgi:Protein phosphatase 2C
LTWRVLAASSIGTAHIAAGRACEDSCWAHVDAMRDGQPLLSMFVADGAGSAAQGGAGADLAIQAAAEFVGQRLQDSELLLSDALAIDLLTTVRDRIRAEADQSELKVRDFACTFLGLVGSQTCTLVTQVGDGGIVLDVGDGLEMPIVPMVGEYANMTHFATDDDALERLNTRVYTGRTMRAALFSDGLQRLAIHMSTNSPHAPFFSRFFKVLAETPEEKHDEIHNALLNFLKSPAVNQRTDDDKTLALALMV